MNETSTEFFSQLPLNAVVEFRPMFRQQQQHGIADEYLDGRVVAVRFTEQKVFYDVLSRYHGIVFENVDSAKVKGVEIVSQALPQLAE